MAKRIQPLSGGKFPLPSPKLWSDLGEAAYATRCETSVALIGDQPVWEGLSHQERDSWISVVKSVYTRLALLMGARMDDLPEEPARND